MSASSASRGGTARSAKGAQRNVRADFYHRIAGRHVRPLWEDGTVNCCVEGHGTIRIGDDVFEWGPRDIFVAPSWQMRTLSAATEAVLFGYSDRPVQEALGLLREETISGANQ